MLWPKTLLPEKLPKARVLAFGYDADVVNFWSPAGQNRIGDHAQNLVANLADLRDETDTVSSASRITILYPGRMLTTRHSQVAPSSL